MKKLIAIAVVLALVAGAAFADIDLVWSGGFGYKVEIAKGTYAAGKTQSTTANTNASLKLEFKDSDGKYGAYLNFFSAGGSGSVREKFPDAQGWWKPNNLFKLTVGKAGVSGTNKIGYGLPDDVKMEDKPNIRFYEGAVGKGWDGAGGNGDEGVLFSIYPADFVEIHLALPFGKTRPANHNSPGGAFDNLDTERVFGDIVVGTIFKFEGAGEARLNFVSNYAGASSVTGNSAGNIYAAYYLTKLEKVKMDVGLNLGLPYTSGSDTVSPGVGVSFALQYIAAPFDLKFRTGAFLGSTKPGDTTRLGIQLVPSLIIAALPGGNVTAFLDTVLNLKFVTDTGDPDKDLIIDGEWLVNPCFKVPLGNKLTFNAGLQLSGGFAADLMKWSIPVGMRFSF